MKWKKIALGVLWETSLSCDAMNSDPKYCNSFYVGLMFYLGIQEDSRTSRWEGGNRRNDVHFIGEVQAEVKQRGPSLQVRVGSWQSRRNRTNREKLVLLFFASSWIQVECLLGRANCRAISISSMRGGRRCRHMMRKWRRGFGRCQLLIVRVSS